MCGEAGMKVRLVVAQGSTRTREMVLRKAETIVGRGTGCGLRIPSAEVSRQHCRLAYKDGFLTVEDLNSANGTYLNGHRVAAKHLVRPGDTLQIGPLTFLVEYELTDAAPGEMFPAVESEGFEVIDGADESELVPVELDDQETTKVGAPENPDAPIPLELEDEDIGHLPEQDDLRDILSHLEE
jgi:pSer/pThr/pTyr-binding forkhead associated (FHA) protein